MLDDLRSSASSSFEEIEQEAPSVMPESPKRSGKKSAEFLGMTPFQRFIIALLLFMMTCLLGAFCLIAFGKVVIPV